MIRDVIPPEEWVQESMTVHFNGTPVSIALSSLSITMNGRPAEQHERVEDGAIITVKATQPAAPVFSDVFRYVDVSLEKPSTDGLTRLVMLINGEPASFHSELQAGDKLELYWE